MTDYQPWRFADRYEYRRKRAEMFMQNAGAGDDQSNLDRWRIGADNGGRVLGGSTARQVDTQLANSNLPSARPKEGGGGPFDFLGDALGAVKDAAGEAVHAGVKAISYPFEKAAEYVGDPAFGVISGLTSAERRPILDAQGRPTGRYYRKTADFGDVASSIAEAVQHPIRAYEEGGQATEEYFADPNKNDYFRAAGRAAINPLSFIGPAGASRIVGKLGIDEGSLVGRVAENVLNQGGGGAVLGASEAAAAEQDYGSTVPGWNRLSPDARQLIAGILGGAAGGNTLARIKRGEQPFGLQTEEVGPQKSPDLIRLPHDQITERPDLFQGRNADEGKSYNEANVQRIVREFDPNQLTPGLVAHDTSTGQYVVIRGHHRLEAQRRLAAEGKFPQEGTWEVTNADLSNPEHVNTLREQAILSNYGENVTRIDEDVKGFKTLLDVGNDPEQARRKMKFSSTKGATIEGLINYPDDLLTHLADSGVDPRNAGSIGDAVSKFSLNEADLRSLYANMGPGSDAYGLGAKEFRRRVNEYGETARMMRDTGFIPEEGQQTGIEGAAGADAEAWKATRAVAHDAITHMQQKRAELEAAIRKRERIANDIDVLGDTDLSTRARALSEEQVATLNQQIQTIVQDFHDELTKRAPKPRTEPAPADHGAAGEAPGGDRSGVGGAGEGSSGPLPGQAGLFGDEPVAAAEPVAQGLADIGQAGGAIVDNYYKMIAERLRTPEGRAYLQSMNETWALDAANKGITDAEGLRQFANAANPPAGGLPTARPSSVSRTAEPQIGGSVSEMPDQQIPLGGEPQMGPPTHDWQQGFGTEPPKPTNDTKYRQMAGQSYDLFGALPRGEQMRQAGEYLTTMRGKLNQGLRQFGKSLGLEHFDKNLVLDTMVRPFVVGEKNRTDNLINHWTAWAREQVESGFRRTGITVAKAEDDGNYHINGDASLPAIEDVVEQSSDAGRAYYESMTPEQKAVIDQIQTFNEMANKTIEYHGGTVGVDEGIQGSYFPRKVAAIGEQARTNRASSHRKGRTMESIEEGVGRKPQDEGPSRAVSYENPFDAYEAGLRGKLRDAQDAYMVETLKPLAVKPDSKNGVRAGFGYDYVQNPAFQAHPLAKPLLFPQDVADRINEALNRNPENFLTKLPKGINAFLTPLRATGDVSATFQQGMNAWLQNPAKAAQYWTATVHSLADPEAYFRAIDRIDQEGPGLNEHIRWGGHYTSPHSVDDYLLPALADKVSGGRLKEIPVGGMIARKSNEHFSRFLNLTRFDQGNQAWNRAQALGLEGASRDKYMRDAWNAINRASGWSGRRPTTLESIAAFAPRYLSATVEQTVAAFTKGGIEGTIARQHLGRLAASGAAFVWMINTARGYQTDFDPTSSNFLRIRNVAGLDVSPLGSYDTLVHLVAGTFNLGPGHTPGLDITKIGKFAESKMSPALKLIYEPVLKGETYLGEPLDITSPGGLAKTLGEEAKSTLPFNVQDLIEEGPAAALVGSTGLSARLMTPKEKLQAEQDKISDGLFNKRFSDLSGAEKSKVNEQKSVASLQAEADAQDQRRGGESAQRVDIRDTFQQRMAANAKFLAEGKDDAGNPFTGNDYRDAYHDLQQYLAGARSTLQDIAGGDKEVSGWFNLFDKATMSNGALDFDKLDALQGTYRAAHPGIDAKVDAVTGIHDDATLRDYREAQKQAREYYDLPTYRGLTTDQSRQASEVLMLAQGMVQSGQMPDMKRALARLSGQNAQAVTWARLAQHNGANPDRKRFRTEHTLFSRFYTDSLAA